MQILRKACLGLLRLFGWRTSLTWPPEPRGLIMVYPHTSNWDFPIGVLFRLGHDLPAHWMGKDQMFRWPFRRLLLAIGGLPINRRERTGFVAAMVEEMRRRDWLWIAVAPEGTRARRIPEVRLLPAGPGGRRADRIGLHRLRAQAGRHRSLCAHDGERRAGPAGAARFLRHDQAQEARQRRRSEVSSAAALRGITNGRRLTAAQQ